AGFAAPGDAVAGTGGDLELPTGVRAQEDTYYLVKASKLHESGPLGTGSEVLASHVQLDDALALLVRPDLTRELELAATFAGDAIASIAVRNGEPGVFYALRVAGQAPLAYFHQRDDLDARFNKGLDLRPDRPLPELPPPTTTALRVERDFVLAA